MPYKDPQRRRTVVRESTRLWRAKKKAKADRLEAPTQGEAPCRRCRKRRRTITNGTGAKGSLAFCRTCAGEMLLRMVTHILRTPEPPQIVKAKAPRCDCCGKAATIGVGADDRPELCHGCAVWFSTHVLGQLEPQHIRGSQRAA